MLLTVDPHRFVDLPLLTKAIAENDYRVLADGLRAGRIMLQHRSFARALWFWTVTGPSMEQAGLASSGEAETLEEARQAFRGAFDRWLEWALKQSGAVHWLE